MRSAGTSPTSSPSGPRGRPRRRARSSTTSFTSATAKVSSSSTFAGLPSAGHTAAPRGERIPRRGVEHAGAETAAAE
eukprot:6587063-Heterocapsa_arctica.AAC.1